MTRKRIGNRELARYEDTIALTLEIIQLLKAVMYWIDDPEILEIFARLLSKANKLKSITIETMNERKGE